MMSLTSLPLPEHSVAMAANPCGARQAVESKQLDANENNATKGFTKDAMGDLNIDHADFFKFSFAILSYNECHCGRLCRCCRLCLSSCLGRIVDERATITSVASTLWEKQACDGCLGWRLWLGSVFFLLLISLTLSFFIPLSELAPLAPSPFCLAFGFFLGLGVVIGKPLVSSSLPVPLPLPDLSPLESVQAAKADFGGGCGFPLGAPILSSF